MPWLVLAACSKDESAGGSSQSRTVCNSQEQFQCDPLTNAGCGSGEACDRGDTVKCYPAGPGTLGAACDPSKGPYCIPTLLCAALSGPGSGQCRKYCCGKEGCAAGEVCESTGDGRYGSLGYCLSSGAGGGGSGGAGGTGGGGSDPCSECLKGCQGMSSCCTGSGCLCESECEPACVAPNEFCCTTTGDCWCMPKSQCPY
jgi:hypothetical protein